MRNYCAHGAAFPVAIRQKRIQAGLSLKQMGELIGVSKSTISFWESGRSAPSSANAKAVCSLLGIDPAIFEEYDVDWVGFLVEKSRKALGLSREELAELACVGRHTVWRIERGVHQARAESIAAIAWALCECATRRNRPEAIPEELVNVARNCIRNKLKHPELGS